MSFSAVLMRGPGPHFPVVNEISGTGYAGASLMNLIEHMMYSLKDHRETKFHFPFTTRDLKSACCLQYRQCKAKAVYVNVHRASFFFPNN